MGLMEWGSLHSHLLSLIFNRLSFVDVLRAKSVCSHWNSVAKQLTSYTDHHQIPWLLIPPREEDVQGLFPPQRICQLYNPEEKKIYKINNMPKEIGESYCIGSPHGCIIFFDIKCTLFILLNPLNRSRIELPASQPLLKLANILQISKVEDGRYRFKYVGHQNQNDLELLQQYFRKVVLTSDPFRNNSYGLVSIWGYGNTGLVFYNGKMDSWAFLDSDKNSYTDVIHHKNELYALCGMISDCIEIWDLLGSDSPVRKASIRFSCTRSMKEGNTLFADFHITKYYLVESCGDILFVRRFFAVYLDERGCCRYYTYAFCVLKLDLKEKRWVEVESLKDRVLFLGGNDAVSISANDYRGCEGDCIYFTDDFLLRPRRMIIYDSVKRMLNEGDDVGVFRLNDRTIKHFYGDAEGKIQPPACWVLPNPW